jgi:hypothetical protein
LTKVLLLVPLLEPTDALKYPYVEDRALVLLERIKMITIEPKQYQLTFRDEVVATFTNKQSYKTFKKWFNHLQKVYYKNKHTS